VFTGLNSKPPMSSRAVPQTFLQQRLYLSRLPRPLLGPVTPERNRKRAKLIETICVWENPIVRKNKCIVAIMENSVKWIILLMAIPSDIVRNRQI
jgi:hypothetical protein